MYGRSVLWLTLAVLAAGPADLAQIKERGTLRVLVFGADEEFLPRDGSPRARDRDLLTELASREGLTLEVVVEPDFDRLFTRLLAGEGDVIAHGLTVTPERAKRVAFSRPVATVNYVLVGKRGAKGLPRKAAQLKGRSVTVHPNSAYAQALARWSAVIDPAPEGLDSEGVVYQVGRGDFALTVTDSNVFESISTYNRDVEALCTMGEGIDQAWAVRPDAPRLKAALDAFLVEKALTAHTERRFVQDLDGIKKRGALRLLTWNDPVSYFGYRGQLLGFDYELAKLLAARLNVRLEVVVPPERSLLVPWLLEGRGDLVAATMHPSTDPAVANSTPYLFSDQVQVGEGTALVQASDPVEQVQRALDGSGPSVLVDRVLLQAMGEVANANKAPVVQPDQPLVYLLRKNTPKLQKAVNAFVKATYQGLEYNMLKKQYFEANRAIDAARAADVGRTGTLSPYDSLFREHAARVGIDWRLLAAQCFQESRFDPKARSWAGAVGLFQLMPSTAQELGVRQREDPAESIRAGADYDARMLGRVEAKLALKEQLRFALAAYNVGLGHVEDAQRLAAELGLDPLRWFNHVERAMLLLEQPRYYRAARHGYCKGSEPVTYVSRIQAQYESWLVLMP